MERLLGSAREPQIWSLSDQRYHCGNLPIIDRQSRKSIEGLSPPPSYMMAISVSRSLHRSLNTAAILSPLILFSQKMNAVQVVQVGAPLEFRKLAIPEPASGQVVAKQKYSSANPLDYKVQHAVTQGGLPLPVTLEWDISGVIVTAGEGVTKFKIGDEVFGFTNIVGGAFAQYVPVNIEHIVPRRFIPGPEAGAIPVVFTTAWVPLYVQDDLSKRRGQGIYIASGSGGIGHIAIQPAASTRVSQSLRALGNLTVCNYVCIAVQMSSSIIRRKMLSPKSCVVPTIRVSIWHLIQLTMRGHLYRLRRW
jgi:hypothetical protein